MHDDTYQSSSQQEQRIDNLVCLGIVQHVFYWLKDSVDGAGLHGCCSLGSRKTLLEEPLKPNLLVACCHLQFLHLCSSASRFLVLNSAVRVGRLLSGCVLVSGVRW